MADQSAPTKRERGGAAPDLGATSPASGAVVSVTTTPDSVGRFEIESELGSGGMGVVYAAFDPTLDRRVAVKLLRDDLPSRNELHNQQAQARLAREARAMARLQHPNVVTVYEVGIHEGHVFLVMEYVAGGTLRSWLNQRHAGKGPSWQRILAVFVAAGRGLAAAHAAGLVHRDFKPDNVLLDFGGESQDGEPGRVLVSDFGIANVYGDDLTSSGPGEPPRQLAVTRTGATLGTPLYMSPEQHLGRAIDARTDQFSFCASLYEALYGVAPFGNDDLASISVNAIDGVLAPIPTTDHGVPAYVHAAMLRGLRPAPGERFPTMSALLEALAPPAPRRWPRYAIAGGAAAAAGTAIVYLAMRSPEAPVSPARRAKPTCDCEMFAVKAPPGGRVTGIRAAGGGPSHMPELGPDDELVIPRGHYLIEYTVDRPYAFGVVSAGMGAARTLALPEPELLAGWRFVPGGAVSIGEASTSNMDEYPASVVQLEPYLVQIDESEPITYAQALQRAREAGARIPTAAEWEWAARNGAGDHMLSRSWEWTSTSYAPYPYLDDGRDDPLAQTPTVEVRGGQTEVCPKGTLRDPCPTGKDDKDAPRAARRIAGIRAARAELRMVRAPKSAKPPMELLLHLRHDEEGVLTKKERAALGRFVFAAGDRALQFLTGDSAPGCRFGKHLETIGVDVRRVAIVTKARTGDDMLVRWHPDPKFLNEEGIKRCIVTDTAIEILDIICFENEHVRPRSKPIIDAIAATLKVNDGITLVEIGAHIDPRNPDGALEKSQRRAEEVVRMLVERGVAAERLVAQGYGVTQPLSSTPLEDVDKRQLLGQPDVRCPGSPGDRVHTLILKRTND